MATVKDLEAQLKAMTESNRNKESELRKQIAKQKKSEEHNLIMAIGKFAKKRFYTLETIEDFENFFYGISIPDPPVRKEEIPKKSISETGAPTNQMIYQTTSAAPVSENEKFQNSQKENPVPEIQKSEIPMSQNHEEELLKSALASFAMPD